MKRAIAAAVWVGISGCNFAGNSSSSSSTAVGSTASVTSGASSSGAHGSSASSGTSHGSTSTSSTTSSTSSSSTGSSGSTASSSSSSGVTGSSASSSSGSSGSTGACAAAQVADAGSPGNCDPNGVCRATNATFSSVIAFAANDAWAVAQQNNTGSAVFHYNGTDWLLAYGDHGTYVDDGGNEVAQDGDVRAITQLWGTSDSDLWGVGFSGDGSVIHYDGTQWTALSANLDNPGGQQTYSAVWGSSSSDVWIGARGQVVHWNGCTFDEPSNVGGLVQALWGSASNDVWAVGATTSAGALLAHWDGTSWTDLSPQDPDQSFNTTLYGVWGSGPNDVWAVGDDQRSAEFISGATYGTVLHYDGTSWQDVPTPVIPAAVAPGVLSGIWGDGTGKLWAVEGLPGTTGQGAVLSYTNATWSTADLPWLRGGQLTGLQNQAMYGVAGNSQYDVWVVGDSTSIYHWDGSEWTNQLGHTSSTTDLGIVSFGAGDVWAASVAEDPNAGAEGDVFSLQLMAYDGVSWRIVHQVAVDSATVPPGGFGFTNRLTGLGGSDLWIPAVGGAYHFGANTFDFVDGGVPYYPQAPQYPTFDTIYEDTSTNLWMAGQGCLLMQGQGVSGADLISWTESSHPLLGACGIGTHLRGVWGLHGGSVWSVGDPHGGVDGGTFLSILHGEMDTGSWVDESVNAQLLGTDAGFIDSNPTSLNAVFGLAMPDGGADVWAAGTTVIRRDGQGVWSTIPEPDISATYVITSIWGAASDDLWFTAGDVGTGTGELFHWDGTSIAYVGHPSPDVSGNLVGVTGSSATDVWFSGDGSTLMHYAGP